MDSMRKDAPLLVTLRIGYLALLAMLAVWFTAQALAARTFIPPPINSSLAGQAMWLQPQRTYLTIMSLMAALFWGQLVVVAALIRGKRGSPSPFAFGAQVEPVD